MTFPPMPRGPQRPPSCARDLPHLHQRPQPTQRRARVVLCVRVYINKPRAPPQLQLIMEGSGSRNNLQNAVGMSPSYMIDGDPGRSGGNTYTAQGVEPTLQDYENVFGPSARDIKQDLQRFKRHGRWHLPDILKGPNQFLTDRVDGLITDATNSPFTTKILPYRYKEDVDGKMKWNVWSFDEGLASRVPYEAAARTLTQSKRGFSAYMVRQGMAINLEHNFMMTPQGRENFSRQLNQVIGSIQMTNDLDVHIALILAPSYQKQMRERYYSEDKTPAQICREFVDLFGFVQKNTNALDILIEEAKAVLRTWGSPMPDFMLCNSKLTFQLTMTPEKTSYITQGIDGVKRLRQGPDIGSYRGINIIHSRAFSMETGQRPRDVLRRRVRVAEYYRIPPSKDNAKSMFEFYNEQRDNFFQLSFQDLLRMARNDDNQGWIDSLVRDNQRAMDVALPSSGSVTLGVGPGFYSGSDYISPEQSVVDQRAKRVYIENTAAMATPGAALQGLAFEAADIAVIKGLETHDATDKLSVMLLSTIDPYRGFNFPDIVEIALPATKTVYRNATNASSNCLTSYPRMPPHTYEEVFTNLVRLSAQRSTEWAEMGVPGADEDYAANFLATYRAGWIDGARTTPNQNSRSAWSEIIENRAASARLALQLYVRCAVSGTQFEPNADFAALVQAPTMRNPATATFRDYSNYVYKPAACIWANPNHPLWFTTQLNVFRAKDNTPSQVVAFQLIVSTELVNVIHFLERVPALNKDEVIQLIRTAWSTSVALRETIFAGGRTPEYSHSETLSAIFTICLQQELWKVLKSKGLETQKKQYYAAWASFVGHDKCVKTGTDLGFGTLDATYEGEYSFGYGVETWPTGFTSASARHQGLTFYDLAEEATRLLITNNLNPRFLVTGMYKSNATPPRMFNRGGDHIYDRNKFASWSPEIVDALPPTISPEEAVGMLGILKRRVQGDAAYIRQRGSFCSVEEYVAACSLIQPWNAGLLNCFTGNAAVAATTADAGALFNLTNYPLNAVWNSSHYPYIPVSGGPLPPPPGVFGPGLSGLYSADKVEVVVVRPNIEHYMLGIILGLGGNDLGNTLWGQTELSVYDDSMHGVWGMSYKYHERAIVFNEKNLIRLWDVAYDGYNGGKDDTHVVWTDQKSVQDFKESTNNVSRNYNGKSMMVMAFQHDGVTDFKRNWPSPIVFYDTTTSNPGAAQAAPHLPADYENIQVIPVDEFRVFNNPTYAQQYGAYFNLMPDFHTLHATRKPAGQSSVDQETPSDCLAFQGTLRVIGPGGIRSETLGSGHHGVDYVGVSTVREGKGMKVAMAAPTPYRMV